MDDHEETSVEQGRRALRVGLTGCLGGLEALSYSEAVARIADAEAAGLDGVWVNEEHLGQPGARGTCLSPLAFLAFVAGRTRSLRLGTTVLVLPLHHPLRLAEETATVHELSGHRLHLGVSPGHPGAYFTAFDVDPEQRYADYDATVAALRALWAGERVSMRTSRQQLTDASLQIIPEVPPVIYRGAFTTESAAAAARSDTPLVQHLIQSPESLRRGRAAYRAAAPDARRGAATLVASPVSRFVYLAEDDEQANAESALCAEALAQRLRMFGADRRRGATTLDDLDPVRLQTETAIVGGPATVAGRLRALADELGTDTVNCNLGWIGSVDAAALRRGFDLLCMEVIPMLAGDVGIGTPASRS